MPKRITNQFDKQITFLKPIETKGSLNQTEYVWEKYRTVWAAIKTMQGREYFDAAAAQAENTYRFVTWYMPDITHDMRIDYKGRIFEIVQPPINDNERDMTLTIIAKERLKK